MKEIIFLEKDSENEDDTTAFAAEAVGFIHPGDTILLYGELGSGKTFITREFVRLLGNPATVSSPSFTIVNRYDGDLCIHHIDLYRIEGIRELNNLGLEDIWTSNSINFIEWPQLLEKRIDWNHYRLFIELNTDREYWRHLKLVRYVA
jgi:tRNA threonylcarbamoyladenosine biosynthesis protein TsaE